MCTKEMPRNMRGNAYPCKYEKCFDTVGTKWHIYPHLLKIVPIKQEFNSVANSFCLNELRFISVWNFGLVKIVYTAILFNVLPQND